MTPIPAYTHPIPEGLAFLGEGGSFRVPGGRPFEGPLWRIYHRENRGEWVRHSSSGYGGSVEGAYYASPIDSETVNANREIVERLNPTITFPWQMPTPMTTFRQLPDNTPPVPPDHLIVGWGQCIITDENGSTRLPHIIRETGFLFEDGVQPVEWQAGQFRLSNNDAIYAFPSTSRLIALNQQTVAHYNPTSQAVEQVFRPLPENVPPVSEGYVIVGWGRDFEKHAFTIRCRWWKPAYDQWRENSNGRSNCNDVDAIYALPSNSPSVALNADRVRFYNSIPAEQPALTQPVAEPLFTLSFNGLPINSPEELLNIITPLATGLNPVVEIANVLIGACTYSDPESRLDEWIDREPVIISGVDFTPVVSRDVTVEAIAESGRTISELITRAAAGVLLSGGLSNHFQYEENGELNINPTNPPSIEQGYEILKRTLEIKETGAKLDNYSSWTMGMLGDKLEALFGDAFDPSMVMEATNRAYNTYVCALGVYRAYWTNRRNLSYTHHKEAYYAKVEPEEKDFILDTSDRLRLTVADQRKLTSYVRNYGIESLEANPPEDAQTLVESLEVRSVNKNYLFCLPARNNQWFEFRGPFELIPNGANPIFNADTRARLTREGEPERLEAWIPVGDPVPPVRGHGAVLQRARAAAAAGDEPVVGTHRGNARPRHQMGDVVQITPADIPQELEASQQGREAFIDAMAAQAEQAREEAASQERIRRQMWDSMTRSEERELGRVEQYVQLPPANPVTRIVMDEMADMPQPVPPWVPPTYVTNHGDSVGEVSR